MKKTATLLFAVVALLALPAAAEAGFGIQPGSVSTTFLAAEGGLLSSQASSHPYSLKFSFKLNTDGEGRSEGGEMRDFLIDLPPGLSGIPFALSRCTRHEFEGGVPRCSPNTQVGIVQANIPGFGLVTGPIYNLIPPPGTAAQLGFSAAGLNAFPRISVRGGAEDYGLHVATFGMPLEITAYRSNDLGHPGRFEPRRPARRQSRAGNGSGGDFVGPHLAFLNLPAQCSAPLETTVAIDSKLDPGHFISAMAYSLDSGGNTEALVGCGSVPFAPKVAAASTSRTASASSGLDFELNLPNEGLDNPNGIARNRAAEDRSYASGGDHRQPLGGGRARDLL